MCRAAAAAVLAAISVVHALAESPRKHTRPDLVRANAGAWVCRTPEAKAPGDVEPTDRLERLALTRSPRALNQLVFIDFDSGADGSIVYTSAMRDDIIAIMETVYADFSVTFTTVQPTSGDYSTITLNSGSPGGIAEGIDFRNLNPNDNAIVNIDGLGLSSELDIVWASANIASHELGHILGLRHHDSFGPVGFGVPSSGIANQFIPAYPGPQSANESFDHIMVSPGSVGSSLADATSPSWFSEREAMKLQVADTGVVAFEAGGPKGTIATAQPVTLEDLPTPNTIVSGDNAGLGSLDVRQLTLIGSLGAPGEMDFYEFDATTGVINIEVLSRIAFPTNSIDSQVRVYDFSGVLVPYHGSTAFNDDEHETTDAFMVDLTLPGPGTYYLEVRAFSGTDTGDYEIFLTEFLGAAPCNLGDADLNGDNSVDGADLASLLAQWGTDGANGGADLTGDGIVDGADLAELLASWGAC